jgi:pSer/pThr/pTyr-binding forkhead associated (FHA) protein
MTKLYILNGPKWGESFQLFDGATFIGCSRENDIRIEDKTVSRQHLRVEKRGNEFFITDLNSQNGTFYHGNYLAPGVEREVKKDGAPIAIGMSLICLGDGCIEKMMPVLESVGLTEETGEQSGIFLVHRDKTNQKKLELLHKISEALSGNLSINIALEKTLNYVFDLLKRIDKAAFILVDPETEQILDVISKTTKLGDNTSSLYCTDVVRRVIKERKPRVISNVRTEESDEIVDTLKRMKIESVMCVPLITDSQIVGVIYVESLERPFKFAKEDISFFKDLCKRTACSIEMMRFAFNSTTIADNPASGT